ncbi:Cation efflux system protein CusB precursor [Rosistilla oblonga]|uniref:Cation efflux system protein CusB n=2 Tax=Rosistilla TaxID=2795779 RepID=A0A518IQN4_9BACT|nr:MULTISPECIES: efflux RND transporter periplasmic adaptor subunit [Rosistilla]QDV55395.1 Cation efflux system protein CusB precursor [Rosistilla oblonga]QDV68084.1 Cation efflux system protein CusB precursor [Rosistilla carotiformis]
MNQEEDKRTEEPEPDVTNVAEGSMGDEKTGSSGDGVRGSQGDVAPMGSQSPELPDSPSASTWLLRTGVQAATVVVVAGLVFFLLGVAQRTQWLTADGFSGGKDAAVSEAVGGEDKRYICPMMCTPPSTEPGRCPVCAMELVEATGGGGGDGISVTIEASARRLVGIQTAMSKMGEVNRTIRTIGSIDFDESQLSTISAYIDGRLEKMYANYAGVKVNEGDDLALIYSPQLYTAQTEFITSMNSDGKIGRFQISGGDLNKMARENLTELGMTESQIDQLGKSGKPMSRIRIKSPQSGTVIEKSAVEGDYVKTGHKLYRVADLSSVWLMLDLFPDDASAVRFGQQVEAEIQSMPGEVFTGRVAFIDPTVNPKTRTVRVRVEIMNFDGKLRPGDYATARVTVPAIPMDQVYDPALANKYISPMHPQVIRDEPGRCPLCDMDLVPTSQLGFASEPLPMQQVVTVPRDAVLLAGENSVIYVETEPGRFEIRRVTVGPMNRQEAVIVEGLAAGETVATGGNFLIDSQMQLAGNPSLMDPTMAPSYSPGPLELPNTSPVMLASDAGKTFDRTYDAYFEIQCAMAADQSPPPVALNTLIEGLQELEMSAGVPDEAQRRFTTARRAAARMVGSLETAREAYRGVSHAMLRAATVARGPKTAVKLTHYYCPMVPGGGGDWMQPGGDLQNPYWGSEMLTCGEVVRDMAMPFNEIPSIARTVQ